MLTAEHNGNACIVDGCPHDVFNIAPIPLQADDLYIRVNRSGYTACTPSNFFIKRAESHRYNVIHCVIRGRGYFTTRGDTICVEQGALFILGAHEAHAYWSDPNDPMGLIWVEYLGGDSTRLTHYILDTNGARFDGEVFDSITKLCKTIVMQADRHNAIICSELYQVLTALCCRCSTQQHWQNTRRRKIQSYIEQHLGDDLSLTTVAKYFGYNSSYFSETFSKVTGMGYSKYVMNRRISQACYLLVTTDYPLSHISQSLGFYDASHFVRKFKSAEGMTPTNYRLESLGLAQYERAALLKDATNE